MYPKRSIQHIHDTKARGLFFNSMPSEWICRELLERDYGIDFLLELVGDSGHLTGHIVAVQLKGTTSIKWRGKGITSHSLYSGIKTSTISYWMSVQVPVFLCVAEFSTGKVFFASVKRQVRQNYSRYLNSRTFGFRLIHMLELSSGLGPNLLAQEYYRERSHHNFIAGATDIVIHAHFYNDFINGMKTVRDREPVSISDQITLGCLYGNIQIIRKYTGSNIEMRPLEHFFQLDKKNHPVSKNVLHGSTIKKVIKFLEPEYRKTMQINNSIITKQESNYWKHEDPVLYRLYERI